MSTDELSDLSSDFWLDISVNPSIYVHFNAKGSGVDANGFWLADDFKLIQGRHRGAAELLLSHANSWPGQ